MSILLLVHWWHELVELIVPSVKCKAIANNVKRQLVVRGKMPAWLQAVFSLYSGA